MIAPGASACRSAGGSWNGSSCGRIGLCARSSLWFTCATLDGCALIVVRVEPDTLAILPAQAGPVRRDPTVGLSVPGRALAPHRARERRLHLTVVVLDRKSTRLNSSH